MKLTFYRHVPVLLCLFAAVSCRKNTDTAGTQPSGSYPYAQCQLSRIDIHGNGSASFYRTLQYNTDGTLARIQTIVDGQISSSNTFQLFPGLTVITGHDGGPDVSQVDSVFFIGGSSLVASISYTRPVPFPAHFYNVYHYSNGIIDSVEALDDFGRGFTTFYEWQNGDLVSDSNYATGVLKLSYYTDKPAPPPIRFMADNYQYFGRPWQPSKHLLRDVIGLIHHTYAFDQGGKLIADTPHQLPPPSPQTPLYYETYSYDCH